MKNNQASITAIMTAYTRAYHAKYANQKIFDDYLVYNLIPEETLVLIEKSLTWAKKFNDPVNTESNSDLTNPFASLMQATNVLSRARFAEDTLERAVKQGVKQYVILGAGLDTFAFRRLDLVKQLEVFEVDFPSTQESKLLHLAELGWEHPVQLHFIPIDFTKENLITALTRSPSYDPKVKSLFSWLGVTMYLTRDEVFSTLSSIKEVTPKGSMVVFDYFDIDAFIPEKMSPQMKMRLEVLQIIGEPMITGFNPSTLADELSSIGFQLHENLNPSNIEERYFKGHTDGCHAQEHGHIAYAVV